MQVASSLILSCIDETQPLSSTDRLTVADAVTCSAAAGRSERRQLGEPGELCGGAGALVQGSARVCARLMDPSTRRGGSVL